MMENQDELSAGAVKESELNTTEAFWRQAFPNTAAPTSIGIGRIDAWPLFEQIHWKKQSCSLSAARATDLRQFVQTNALEIKTLLQAAWALLLYRYSSELTVLFGNWDCSVSQPLPLLIKVSADASSQLWLLQLQTGVAQHHSLPLIRCVSDLLVFGVM
jgi:hypothetical protein